MQIRVQHPSAKWLSVLLTCFTLGFSLNLYAVELQPGIIYKGGTQISVSALGVNFTVPQQWKGGLAPSGEVFLMEPVDATATMFVIADTLSVDQTYQNLQGPVQLSQTIQLTLKGHIQRERDAFSAQYDVTLNPQLSAEVRAKSGENGTSIAFFLVGTSSQMPGLVIQLDQVFSGLNFQSNQTEILSQSQPVENTGEATDKTWLTYLKGKHIVRFFTGSGYTEEQHLWLCSDGNYVRRFDSGGFGDGASGAFQGNFNGTWTATGEGEYGKLVLNATDGQSIYNLRWDYNNNHLYVDDKRWLHDKNNICS